MKPHITKPLCLALLASFVSVNVFDGSVEAATLPGVTNTIAQQATLDATSHHLDLLRSRINKPAPCTLSKAGLEMPAQRNNTHLVYEGGYDSISGQAAMGKYSRTWNGLLLGVDRQLCCCATLGVAFGYEHSIARAPETRFANDTYFIDLYSAVRTGKYDHKFTAGVGIFNFDTRRGTTATTTTGTTTTSDFALAKGSMNAHSIDIGYELSRDFTVESWYGLNGIVTPFLDFNYAYIDIDNLREHGAGEASLKTDFDSMNLVQLALGGRYTVQFRGLSKQDNGTLCFSAAAVAEFSDHRPDAVVGIAGTGTDSYKVKSLKRQPFYGQFGIDAVLPLTTNWDMVAGGYGRVGNDRGSITGNVGLQYSF